MTDDVPLNKAAIIERCILRMREVFGNRPGHLHKERIRQESILLHLQRACEAAIDLAMPEVRWRRLGAPQESREAFSFLEGA